MLLRPFHAQADLLVATHLANDAKATVWTSAVAYTLLLLYTHYTWVIRFLRNIHTAVEELSCS